MAKASKRYREAEAARDRDKLYALKDALEQVKSAPKAKFDETVDIAINLGVDPKHADQMVRGAIVLPNGVGRSTRVLVFAKGDKEAEARDAGADHVGGDELAKKIQDEGWFDDEIVGIEVPQGRKKDPLQVTADEGVRRDTSLERLAKLRPVFRDGGSVTAGNASQINDGACALLVMSASRAQKLGLQPLARVVSWGHAGVHPGVMGIGPVPASQLALRKVRRARARRRCSATLPTHAGLVSLRPSRAW